MSEDTVSLPPAVAAGREPPGVARGETPAADALARSEARYRTLVEQLPVVVYETPVDVDGTPPFIGPQIEALVGVSAEALAATPQGWLTHVHPDDRARVAAEAAHAIARRTPFASEYRFVHARTGATVWVRDEGRWVPDAAGRPGVMRGVLRDVTELRRRAAERERLHAVTAALAAAVTVEDVAEALLREGLPAVGAAAGAVVRVAPDAPDELEVVRSTGYERAGLVAWTRFPVAAPVPMADCVRSGEPVWVESHEAVRARYPAVLPFAEQSGYQGWLAVPFVIGEGEGRRTLGGFGLAFREERTADAGARAFLLGIGQQAAQALERARLTDAERSARQAAETERAALVRLNAALAESEARFRRLAERSAAGLLIGDMEGRLAYANDALLAMLGYDRADVDPALGGTPLRWQALTPPEDAPKDLEAIRQLAATGHATPYEKHYRARDGRLVPILISPAVTAFTPEGQAAEVAAVVLDRTAEREREQARAAAEAALASERALLQEVFDQLPVGATIVEAPSGRIRYFNVVGERLLGHPMLPAADAGAYAQYGALHADDTPYAAHEYPTARALAGEVVDQHVMRYRRGDGSITHIAASAAPVTDGAGRVVRAVCTWTDVGERVALEAALRQARDAAEQASRAKSEFLANMSHELRTPLNAIAGHVQLLQLGIHGPVTDPQREALGRVMRAQTHLLGLINDVLNYARIEAGRVEYRTEAVDLGDALRDVAALVEPQLVAQRLAFVVRAPDTPCEAWADADKLRQVLLNLLSNAGKFTAAGGTVSLSTAVAPDAPEVVHVLVRDTGIGIPADRLDDVFEPFVQVNTGRTRVHEGTGLGLAISRDLARGMGGDLRVESVAGEGSTFTLVLRRVRSATGAAIDRRAGDERRVDDERRSGDDRRDGDD
jgi:PAS domain S-box-containing protein